MIKPITITITQWRQITNEIFDNESVSVRGGRSKIRKALGFTERTYWYGESTSDGASFQELVDLDFFDERKKTMFIIKYSHIIDEKIK